MNKHEIAIRGSDIYYRNQFGHFSYAGQYLYNKNRASVTIIRCSVRDKIERICFLRGLEINKETFDNGIIIYLTEKYGIKDFLRDTGLEI